MNASVLCFVFLSNIISQMNLSDDIVPYLLIVGSYMYNRVMSVLCASGVMDILFLCGCSCALYLHVHV